CGKPPMSLTTNIGEAPMETEPYEAVMDELIHPVTAAAHVGKTDGYTLTCKTAAEASGVTFAKVTVVAAKKPAPAPVRKVVVGDASCNEESMTPQENAVPLGMTLPGADQSSAVQPDPV